MCICDHLTHTRTKLQPALACILIVARDGDLTQPPKRLRTRATRDSDHLVLHMCLLQQGSRLSVSLEGRYSEVGQSGIPSLERQLLMLGRLSLLLLLLPPLVLALVPLPLPLHHHPCYHLPLFWGWGLYLDAGEPKL